MAGLDLHQHWPFSHLFGALAVVGGGVLAHELRRPPSGGQALASPQKAQGWRLFLRYDVVSVARKYRWRCSFS